MSGIKYEGLIQNFEDCLYVKTKGTMKYMDDRVSKSSKHQEILKRKFRARDRAQWVKVLAIETDVS